LGFSKHIVLVGLSGAGKSTAGPLIAEQLGLAFVDLDQWIESDADCTVAEIFDRWGEPHFRTLEQRALSAALADSATVIATGGGAVVNDESRALVLKDGWMVWLKVSPADAADRTRHNADRPLLQGDEPTTVLEGLLATRQTVYAEAHMVVDTCGKTPGQVANEVCQWANGETA